MCSSKMVCSCLHTPQNIRNLHKSPSHQLHVALPTCAIHVAKACSQSSIAIYADDISAPGTTTPEMEKRINAIANECADLSDIVKAKLKCMSTTSLLPNFLTT